MQDVVAERAFYEDLFGWSITTDPVSGYGMIDVGLSANSRLVAGALDLSHGFWVLLGTRGGVPLLPGYDQDAWSREFDYGHADSSTELDALTTLKDAGGISAEQHRKIVENNPRAFYGLG